MFILFTSVFLLLSFYSPTVTLAFLLLQASLALFASSVMASGVEDLFYLHPVRFLLQSHFGKCQVLDQQPAFGQS